MPVRTQLDPTTDRAVSHYVAAEQAIKAEAPNSGMLAIAEALNGLLLLQLRREGVDLGAMQS